MTAGAGPALRVFGGVSVQGAGTDLGGPKQRAVLALLLVEPRVVVPVDRFVDTIWADRAPARAEASVRGYVSNLRKPVGEAVDGATIDFRDRGYVLDVDPLAIDLHRFDQSARTGRDLARSGDLDAARDALAHALELSAARPFGALADELHLDAIVAAIEQRRGDAAELFVQVRLDLGDHDTIGPDLLGFIDRYPYREGLRVQLATTLYRTGDQVGALRCIDSARRMLADDIGVEPGPELRDVEAKILAHDPALMWSPPVNVSPAQVRIEAAPSTRNLFGRDRELAAVDRALQRLPTGGAVVLSGDAGVGKTALLRHLVDTARGAGVVTGWGRCPESASDAPYRSFTMAVRQAVSRGAPIALVSALAPSDGDIETDATAARLATHLTIADVLRDAAVPIVLVIDDLQWADDATLALLEFLASELDDLPVLLAISVRRATASGLRQPVNDCLAELARVDGALQLQLRGLATSDVAAWLRNALDRDPPDGLDELLTAATDGNPFYLRELLALLDTDGHLGIDGGAALVAAIPAAVQDVIRRRTSRQPPATQKLMAIAAVIGRSFDLDVLATVAGFDPAAALDILGPAIDSGLVEIDDSVVGRYGFSHALVAETLAAEQSPSHLAQLHARITLALEALPADRVDASVEELAHHAFEGASAGTSPQAYAYSLRAADASHRARASADEAEHLRRALAMQPSNDPERASTRVELLMRMGLALRDSGDVLAGRTALVDAAVAAEALNDHEAVAAALGGLSTVDLWAPIDWSMSDPRAVALIERVLARAPDAATATRAALKSDLAAELVYLEPDRATRLSAEAVAGAEDDGDPLVLQRVLLQRFWAVSSPYAAPERAAIGERLIELARSGELPSSFTPLAHLSVVSSALERGHIDVVDAAVAAARATADPGRNPRAWMHLLWAEFSLSMLRGDLDRALVEADMVGRAAWRVRRFTAEFTHAAALSTALAEQARLDDALRAFEPLNHPPYDGSAQWYLAWILASCGRLDAAATALARWEGPVPEDWLMLTVLTGGVLAASAIGDERFVRRHLPALEPLAGHLAVVGNGGPCFGPVDYAIACAKEVLGDRDGARSHAAAAHAQASAMHAVLWLPRIEALTARLD